MDLKQEIRALNSATDLIENIVNHSVCALPKDKCEVPSTVLPNDDISKRYFFILYLELFASVHKEMIPDKEDGDSLIDILNKVSLNPLLNNNEYSTSLNKRTNEFNDWLNTNLEYNVYSANIQQEIEIKLSRKDALYLIGNKSKHTLSRSNSILNKIVSIYKKSGVRLEPNSEILLLEDIDTWLLDDFGGYHFTKLCELCSNLYYSIYEYINPIILSNIKRHDDIRYSFEIPKSLIHENEVFEYYELLNRFRSPWMTKIETSNALLKKY